MHLPGIAYAIVTVFLALGAVNSQNNMLFWALGLALGALLTSGVLSGAALMGIVVEREPCAEGEAGAALRLRYRVSNTNRFVPLFAVTIEEHECSERAPDGPGGARKGRDRPMAFVPYVGAGKSVRVETLIVPRARGVMSLGTVRASSTFPLGMARKSVAFRAPWRVIVRPPMLNLSGGVESALAERGRSGASPGPRVGQGDDFFGLRDYAPGDPVRTIAWKPSARTGSIVVRQHTRPRPSRRWILADFSGIDPAHEHAAALKERILAVAATIIGRARAEEVPLGLRIPGLSLAPRAGDMHARRLLNALASAEVAADPGEPAQLPPPRDECIVVHAGGSPTGIDVRGIDRLLRDLPASPVVRRLLDIPEGVP